MRNTPSYRVFNFPLIFLVGFNLLPQIGLRPAWVVGLSAVLWIYRLWLEFSGKSMPPRWIIWAVQGVVGFAVWNYYRSFLGDEAGGTLLTLLVCLKIFELRQKRDYFITALLCVLVLMSYLLLEQGLMMTSFLLIDVVLIMSFLLGLEDGRWASSYKRYLRRSFTLALRAVPLLILIFVLFPRFSTGFGTGGRSSGTTGVTDALHPGALAQLIPSDELVFRATFLDGEIPPRPQLYWRGAVLDQSNGLDWGRSKNIEHALPSFDVPPRAEIEIYLEPGSDRFLFSPENTQFLSFPNESRVVALNGNTYGLVEPLQNRQRYYVKRSAYPVPESLALDTYLQLGQEISPQLKKFLHKFENLPPEQVIAGLLHHFHEGGYHYSLEAPPAASLDDFFFKTKTGFCEHYAGTLGTLLRALKIPARVVVGYQGGTPSFLENYISVRGHDAHAWVEYYDLTGKRWRRVDPTAQVAPERLTVGSDSYSAVERGLLPSWAPGDWSRYYLHARAFVDEVDASWISFLLNFDLARQKQLLAKLGMEEALFRALPVFLLLSLCFVLAVLYFLEAQKRERLTLDEKLYRQLQYRLARRKIVKTPQEGPRTLMRKIEAQNSGLAEVVAPIMEALIAARFAQTPLTRKSYQDLSRLIRHI